MNEKIGSLFLIVVLLLTGAYVSFDVIAGGGNEVGNLAFYLLLISFVLGVSAPRKAVLWMCFICGYVDLIKRLLIVAGRFNPLDLYYILGIPPVTVVGAVMGVLFGAMWGRYKLQRGNWQTLAFATGFSMIALVYGVKSGGFSFALKSLADVAAYSFLVFLIPVLFASRDDVRKLIRSVLWMYVPMAFYVVWQFVYGYADFERDYLLSGYSTEIRLLYDIRQRPFSTLNSPQSAGAFSAALFVLSMSQLMIKSTWSKGTLPGWMLPFFFCVVYFTATFLTITRASHLVWLSALPLVWFYRKKGRTITAYVGAFVLFAALVLSAEKLLPLLGTWELDIQATVNEEGDETKLMFTRIGTYGDRLLGFSKLVSSPEMYSLFGKKDEFEVYGDVYAHDLIGNFLINYGVIPTVIMLGLLGFVAVKIHKASWKLEGEGQSLLVWTYATVSGLLAISILAGGIIFVFPVNMMFWLLIGISGTIIAVAGRDAAIQLLLEPQAAAQPMVMPARPGHFAPVEPAIHSGRPALLRREDLQRRLPGS